MGSAKRFGHWNLLKSVSSALFALLTFALPAQSGGDNVFEFVNLSASARTTALGGFVIGVFDNDQTLALNNPALLNPAMNKQLSLNHNFNFAGIQNGFASYGHHVEKWKTTFHAGIQYTDYGTFNAADEMGNLEGEFKASEFAIVVGAGRMINERMSLGSNMKLITSQLADYSSLGLMFDLGLTYQSEDKSAVYSAVLKNIGGQLTAYVEDGLTEPVPFELQFGITKRLKHLPFRFSVIVHSLQDWNLLYDNPNANEQATLFIDESSEASAFDEGVDNFFRHFIFGGEFLLGKNENFNLRFAYNHRRKKELSVANARSLAGFSMGFGFKVNRFKLDYGMGVFHLAGTVKHVSISTNIGSFGKVGIVE